MWERDDVLAQAARLVPCSARHPPIALRVVRVLNRRKGGAVGQPKDFLRPRCRDRDAVGWQGGTVADRDPLKAEKSKQSAKKVGCPTPCRRGMATDTPRARLPGSGSGSQGSAAPSDSGR